jgi:hypothetical protein
MKDDAVSRIHAYLDGEMTGDELRAFGNWLHQDPSNVDLFVAESRLHSALFDALGEVSLSSSSSVAPPLSAPVAIHISEDFHNPFTPFSSFLIPYTVAALLVAVGIAIGWLCQVPVHQQIAQDSQRRLAPRDDDPPMVFVGRVTGMANCEWADRKTEAINGAHVPLGRKYSLASGLMEITYESGARVILQGPCEYEVQSNAGGYLADGRLTVRVERKPEAAKRPQNAVAKSEVAKAPPAIQTALFSIRTPTAVVTDLGTEFGVEVTKAGVTKAHVFLGKVKIEGERAAGAREERTLLAGEAASFVPRQGLLAVSVPKYGEKRFVRKMPPPRSPSFDLIEQVDYSDTWSANSPTRTGSYLMLETPESLRVEQCYNNPPRSWTFSTQSAMTTWPFDDSPVQWPGFQVQGARSGFTETGWGGSCQFGFEYGLRDDFVVQFDAVQSQDRINITIGDKPATIGGAQSLSVFFRAAGAKYPEIGIYTPTKGEADTGIRSGISSTLQWHSYAVRFNRREKRLTVWVDGRFRGTIDLAAVKQGMENGRSWADLPWTGKCVTVGGDSERSSSRLWTDNFRVGSPRLQASGLEEAK